MHLAEIGPLIAGLSFVGIGLVMWYISPAAARDLMKQYEARSEPRPLPTPWWNPRPSARFLRVMFRLFAVGGVLIGGYFLAGGGR